jgi:hypothetical protein
MAGRASTAADQREECDRRDSHRVTTTYETAGSEIGGVPRSRTVNADANVAPTLG